MGLAETVNSQIITAMKAKDETRLRALRNIKSAFLLLQTSENGSNLSDDDYIKSLQKLAKQRKDSIEIFAQQGREDLASKEREELAILEEFLPAQMDENAISEIVKNVIAEVGARGPQDMGKVMPKAMAALAGKADGKIISEVVKKLL